MVVAHAAGLLRAARGVCLGIKIQYNPLATEVGQLDRAALLVGQLEVRSLVAGFDHGGDANPPNWLGVPYMLAIPENIDPSTVGNRWKPLETAGILAGHSYFIPTERAVADSSEDG